MRTKNRILDDDFCNIRAPPPNIAGARFLEKKLIRDCMINVY